MRILNCARDRYEDDCLVPPLWCEKDHRLVRIEVAYNEASGAVTCGTQEILINDWCTGSNHHGGGGMSFLSNGDMVLAVGDMAKVCTRSPNLYMQKKRVAFLLGSKIFQRHSGSWLEADICALNLAPVRWSQYS